MSEKNIRASSTVLLDEPHDQPPHKPRVLLTNDDGIESAGLRRLAVALASCCEVVVVAPREDRSGSGTGIGRFDPRKGVEMRAVELEGLQAYALDGPPGLAVLSAALGAFGRRADLVVSGPNAGMNTGHSVLHSGTVGAVLTARTFGIRGLAVSLAASDPWHWETAAEIGACTAEWLLARDDGPRVLNVNVPALPLDRVRGARWARLDEFGHFLVASADEHGELLQFELAAADTGRRPDCDTALCAAGYVALTPLSAIEAEPFPAVDADEACGGLLRH